jgi:hypothetical protein
MVFPLFVDVREGNDLGGKLRTRFRSENGPLPGSSELRVLVRNFPEVAWEMAVCIGFMAGFK